MEIGISSYQLSEIGLNLAGFLAAGGLLLIIQSFFTGRPTHKKQLVLKKPAEVGGNSTAISEEPAEMRPAVSDGIQFVDLNGVGWKGNRSRSQNIPVKNSERNSHQEVINLAAELIARKNGGRPTTGLSHPKGTAMAKNILNYQTAGRS